MQLAVDRFDPFDLFIALLDVSIVLDAAEDDPGFFIYKAVCTLWYNDSLTGAVGMRTKASLVHAL